MVFVGSVGLGIPPYHLSQEKVKNLMKDIFIEKKIKKLLPVFDNAKIKQRQFVVDKEWIKQNNSFAMTNERYVTYAKELSLEAIDSCLKNSELLKHPISYEAVDMIVFVSSTGIVTPSLDAYLLNDRSFREDVVRMPLWGLGCAGGAMGLSRAYEWLQLHPNKTALVICSELCSLTFQKGDNSSRNIVGTALFGDGVAATLLIGQESPYLKHLPTNKLQIKGTSTFTKKNSTNVMGWNVTNDGFEVIFSKGIPKLVKSLWKEHVAEFLQKNNKTVGDLSAIIAHPGGRKVLEEMESALSIDRQLLKYSYNVLENHGNMSSATVLYVLNKWLKDSIDKSFFNKEGILSALGPGFSSELLLMEWMGK